MILTDKLSNIANAIRSKTGKSEEMTLDEMPVEIEGIFGNKVEKPFDCHSVTFVYGDKSYVRSVADGDTCADPVERGLIPTPTKESTAQYNYTFYGWGSSDGGAADAGILKNITEDKTVYAIFTSTVRYYTITWLDEDGVTELPGQKQWAYGSIPSYTPTKEGVTFDKWTPTPAAVTGNATYTASWSVAVVVASGSCGESATWFLGADGVLTISGTGAVTDYSMTMVSNKLATTAPWQPHNSKITAFVVKDGITSVGNYVLYKHTSLISVKIADSVTRIGRYAFNGCTALTGAVIGNGVEDIDQYAFSDCSNLSSITIPDGVTSIGDSAFGSCVSLTGVTIPDTVTSIGDSAFGGCSGLTSITIPDSVTSIGYAAFNNCTSLNYNMHDNATYLGNDNNPYMVLIKGSSSSGSIHPNTKIIYYNAFNNYSSLTSITIPDGIIQIGDRAFSYCRGLTSVTIPDSVIDIGSSAFSDCSGLTSITFGSGVKTIGSSAFQWCGAVSSITIPNSVSSIGEGAFYGCKGLTSVTFEKTVGWRVSTSASATSSDAVDVSDPTTAATLLIRTHGVKYWFNT